jgi:hypothetical protein
MKIEIEQSINSKEVKGIRMQTAAMRYNDGDSWLLQF